jgi:hypothetical protein
MHINTCYLINNEAHFINNKKVMYMPQQISIFKIEIDIYSKEFMKFQHLNHLNLHNLLHS